MSFFLLLGYSFHESRNLVLLILTLVYHYLRAVLAHSRHPIKAVNGCIHEPESVIFDSVSLAQLSFAMHMYWLEYSTKVCVIVYKNNV